MLRCADGSYYAGHTDDIEGRMRQHHDGAIGYTSSRRPVELVWQGEFETREGALAFEQQIKGWSRAKKEALVAGDWERIKELAKSGAGLRQAQPERLPQDVRRPDPVRPEPVEGQGTVDAGLRQAQPERLPQDVRRPDPVRPEPVEGQASAPRLRQAQPERPGLLDQVLHGASMPQRRAIAKAITLLESTRPDHRVQADELLTGLLPHAGKSFRLGISGVPGVGKSTFIEALGLYLIAQGHKVAVLTVDPSSSVSGGSILGDKTRMEQLSVNEHAYIRPSPSGGTLGGVAEKTRESIYVFEAAGYDIVIVETVGVGQSETAVAGMTDMFVLMQLPNAGDDLQAIKKGVMELADLVVINKADIDADAATRAQAQITSALRLFTQQGRERGPWQPQVLQLSALKGDGIDRFWSAVTRYRDLQSQAGGIEARRKQQARTWMWERIDGTLRHEFREHPKVKALLPQLLREVEGGSLPASTAARQLLAARHERT
jgi:LAO/AO transport system kinase